MRPLPTTTHVGAERRNRNGDRTAAATSLLSPASQRLLSSLRPLFTLTLREPVRAAAAAFTREGALAHTLTALSMGLARLPKGGWL